MSTVGPTTVLCESSYKRFLRESSQEVPQRCSCAADAKITRVIDTDVFDQSSDLVHPFGAELEEQCLVVNNSRTQAS